MARTAGSTSSTEERPGATAEAVAYVTLGRVVGVHGLHGALRVRPQDGDPTHLFEVPRVWLGTAEEDSQQASAPRRAYEVARAIPGRKGEVRLSLVDVTGREQAEALHGQWVSARTGDLAALPEGEYYAYELEGCRVVTLSGEEVGTVRTIWETGAHDVLVVADARGRDQLVPTAPEIMREVDLDARCITIDAPPGLIEGD